MNDGVGGKAVRHRRSWYRRRLRIQRTLVAAALALMVAVAGWRSATRLLEFSARRASKGRTENSRMRGDVRSNLASLAARAGTRAQIPAHKSDVYPYSVVPGGVRDGDDLRRAAQHDALVYQHYARFNYEHARLVRATEARAVYLSYRLRNRILWTRKRIRLHMGELLLTDGKITARARCGNQVSETPKPEVSEEEPAEDVLDRPVAELEVIGLPFRSALSPPDLPGVEPMAPHGPALFASGFLFPYVPFGVPISTGACETGAQELAEQSHGISDSESAERHCRPHRHRPPPVPEPSTLLLLASGLAAIGWQCRRRSRTALG